MNWARRISPTNLTPIDAPAIHSAALVDACAGFGIVPHGRDRHPPRACVPDAALLDQVRRARIVQIVGPSGAGKTSLLRGIAGALRSTQRVIHIQPMLNPSQCKSAAFDLLTGKTPDRCAALAQAGLAEPRVWARPAGSLSTGEQARLRLAMGMQGSRVGDIVIADEFASSIDRVCAYALSRTVRRWAITNGITILCASAHEDLETMLGPELVIDVQSLKPRLPRPSIDQIIEIELGSINDYRSLQHHHYRSGQPATVVRVLRAIRHVPESIEASGRLLAGVLCASMPTLNSAWRTRAWPGVFNTASKSTNARRLNADLRTISRVIVEPRSRGLGVATMLVRAYLQDPLTPGTEAVAAMGCVCPFFERAGMTAYTIHPDPTDARLLDALHHCDCTPQQLMHADIHPGSLLERELITWGKARKLLRSGTPSIEEIQRLIPLAACRLCSRPRAYAFVKRRHRDERDTRHNTGTESTKN